VSRFGWTELGVLGTPYLGKGLIVIFFYGQKQRIWKEPMKLHGDFWICKYNFGILGTKKQGRCLGGIWLPEQQLFLFYTSLYL
jgi:hypothetical protein